MRTGPNPRGWTKNLCGDKSGGGSGGHGLLPALDDVSYNFQHESVRLEVREALAPSLAPWPWSKLVSSNQRCDMILDGAHLLILALTA
jgi:hypothetical protein